MTLERKLTIAVAGLIALLTLNNALPYVNAKDDSCQTMFCGLDWREDDNNHFFMPQLTLSDHWASYEITDVSVTPWPTPDERRARVVAEWLADETRDKGTEATRAAIDHLCDDGRAVALSFRRLDGPPELDRREDACADDALRAWSRWIPVRLFDTDSRPFEAPHVGEQPAETSP